MKTLSVLHRDLISEAEVMDYIHRHPSWEMTATSTSQGGSPLYYRALTGTGPRFLPETWTQREIDAFQFIWEEMALISVQVEDQEYEEIISFIESRSVNRAPQVGKVG